MTKIKEHLQTDPLDISRQFYTPNVFSVEESDLVKSCECLLVEPIGYTVYAEHIVTYLLGGTRVHSANKYTPVQLADLLAKNMKALMKLLICEPVNESYLRLGNVFKLFHYRFGYLFVTYPEIPRRLYTDLLEEELTSTRSLKPPYSLLYHQTLIHCLGRYAKIEQTNLRYLNPETFIQPNHPNATTIPTVVCQSAEERQQRLLGQDPAPEDQQLQPVQARTGNAGQAAADA